MVGRIGGDEFSLTLLNCDRDRTKQIIENIQKLVQQETADLIEETVTLSIGAVTNLKLPEASFEIIYEIADKALYVAKKAGRNQVIYDELKSL